MNKSSSGNSILTAGAILGVGLMGFFDGIFFHQILQIHNMLSAVHYPDNLVNAEVNMFWDGLFHAFTWITTCIGIMFLWRAVVSGNTMPSTKAFFGSILMGGGLFNLVEGIIDHHILQIHHVVERLGQSAWDLAFLGSGVFFITLGWIFMRGTPERFVPTGVGVAASR